MRTFCLTILFGICSTQVTFAQELQLYKQQVDVKLAELVRMFDRRNDVSDAKLAQIQHQMDLMSIPICLITTWLQQAQATGALDNTKISQLIDDRLQSQARLIADVKKELTGLVGQSSSQVSREIDQLAKRIAANESSFAKIKEEVIPLLNKNIADNRKDIDNDLALLRLAISRYDQVTIDICNRLDAVERDLATLTSNANRPPPVSPAPVPSIDSQSGQERIVLSDSQRIQPEIITYDKSWICAESTPIFGNSCYECHVLKKINGNEVLVTYHGTLYRACSGKIVLVIHPQTKKH